MLKNLCGFMQISLDFEAGNSRAGIKTAELQDHPMRWLRRVCQAKPK